MIQSFFNCAQKTYSQNVQCTAAFNVPVLQHIHQYTRTLRFRLAAPREQSLDYTAGEVTPHVFSPGKPLCCAMGTITAKAF